MVLEWESVQAAGCATRGGPGTPPPPPRGPPRPLRPDPAIPLRGLPAAATPARAVALASSLPEVSRAVGRGGASAAGAGPPAGGRGFGAARWRQQSGAEGRGRLAARKE